jgi:hypothetical protein
MRVNEEIKPLYGIYIIYLIFSIVSENIVLNYISELIIISVLILAVYTLNGTVSFLRSYFNFGALFLVIVSIYVTGADIYTLLVLLKVFLLYKFFQNYNVTIKQLVVFINVTYLLYFLYSLVIYFYMVFISGVEGVNAFKEEVFGLSFYTLFGVEGSTAYIDSYSGLVFIINILLNKNKKTKKFYGSLSFLALMWTTRMTPIVATIGSFAYFYFLPVGLFYVLISFVIIQLGLAIWLQSQPDPVKFFFAAITHNRSLMWTQHFEIFWNTLTLKEFFLTSYDDRYIVQVYGHERDTFNPHNSYFLLLFNSAIGFLTLVYLFLKKSLHVSDNRFKTIIFFILVAAITNSKVIGLGNPVYLLLIAFIFHYSETALNKNKKVILKNVNQTS